MIRAVAVKDEYYRVDILDVCDRVFIYAILVTIIYCSIVFMNILQVNYGEKTSPPQRYLRFV